MSGNRKDKPSVSYPKNLTVDLEDIKITPIGENMWEVEVALDFDSAHDDSLPIILRQVKAEISRRHEIPVGLLGYVRLKKKSIENYGIRLVAVIDRREPLRGDPVLRFLNARSGQGKEYENMLLFLDLHPLKEMGEEVTKDDVYTLLDKATVPREKIYQKAIDAAFKTLSDERTPVKNILLAQGRFPHPSFDGRIEYSIETKEADDDILVSRERVDKHQRICRKIDPQPGEIPGCDVRGIEIPPEEPLDLELSAGEGVTVSRDGREISAARDGIVFIKRSSVPNPSIIARVSIKVEPIEVIEATEVVDITTNRHLEIIGGLKSGSHVVSRGEVMISGDIDEATSVITTGNISVKGNIEGASLISGGRIDHQGNIYASNIVANGELNVFGTVTDSELVGYEVSLDRVESCRITAGMRIKIDTICDDEHCFATTLITGLMEQISEVIVENNEVIDFARKNLIRCKSLLGKEIVDEVDSTNVSMVLLKLIKKIKQSGSKKISHLESDLFKKLLSSIGPLRELMFEKIDLNKRYRAEISRRKKLKSEVLIKSGVETPITVEMSGVCTNIAPTDKPLLLKKENGEIIREEYSETKDTSLESNESISPQD